MASSAISCPPVFLTEAEVRARYARCSRATLWRRCRKGQFPKPVESSERGRLWRLSELEAWAASLPTARAYSKAVRS